MGKKKGQKRTHWQPAIKKPEPKDDDFASASTAALGEDQTDLLTALKTTALTPFEPSKRAYVAAEVARSSQVLIGLEELAEIAVHRANSEPGYYCKLCVAVFPADKVIDHVTSTPHREAFLMQQATHDEMQNGLASLLNGLKEQSAIDQAVTAAAIRYERQHGRMAIGHIFAKSFNQKLLGNKLKPFSRLSDSTVQESTTIPRAFIGDHASEWVNAKRRTAEWEEEQQAMFTKELATASVEPFTENDRCFFQDELKNIREPLVGLETIAEIRCTDVGFYPGYYCRTCELILRGTLHDFIGHMNTIRHIKRFLESVTPLDRNVRALLDKATVSTLPRDFTAAAQRFEATHGRQQVLRRFAGEFAWSPLLKTPRIKPPKHSQHPELETTATSIQVAAIRAGAASKFARKRQRRMKATVARVAKSNQEWPDGDAAGNVPLELAANQVAANRAEKASKGARKRQRKKEASEARKKEDREARAAKSEQEWPNGDAAANPAPKKNSAPVGPMAPHYFDLQRNMAASSDLARPWSAPTRPPTSTHPPSNAGRSSNFAHFYNNPYGAPLGPPGPSWGPEPLPYGALVPSRVSPHSFGPSYFSSAGGQRGPEFSTAQRPSWPRWNSGPVPGPVNDGRLQHGQAFKGPSVANPQWRTGASPAGSRRPAWSETGGTAGTTVGSADALKTDAGMAWNRLRNLMAGQKPGLNLPHESLPVEPVACSEANLPIRQTRIKEREGAREQANGAGDVYAEWVAYNDWLCENPDKTAPAACSAQSSRATPANAEGASERYETPAKRARLTAFASSNFDTPSARLTGASSSIPSHLLHSESSKSRDLSVGPGNFHLPQQGGTHEAFADKGLDQLKALLNSLQGGSTSNYSAGGLPGWHGPSGSSLSGPGEFGRMGRGPFSGSIEGGHFGSNGYGQFAVNTAASEIGSLGPKPNSSDLLRMLFEEKQQVAEQEQMIQSLTKRLGN